MPGFPGFDASAFPGLAQTKWLKDNTNLVWCGYYLGPSPSHSGKDWMGRRAALVTQGWGIAPLYVGEQVTGPGSLDPSFAKGKIDGDQAAAMLTSEKFAAGTAVYLDLENGLPFPQRQADYVASWVDAVGEAGFQPGVYCSHTLAEQVHALRSTARIWAFKVTTNAPHTVPGTNFPDQHPSASGFTGAFAFQLGQACRITVPPAPHSMLEVDLDTALTPDPGKP